MRPLPSLDTLITHREEKWSNNQAGDHRMKSVQMDSSFGNPGAINPRSAKMPSQPWHPGAVHLPLPHQQCFPPVNSSGWWPGCDYGLYPPVPLPDFMSGIENKLAWLKMNLFSSQKTNLDVYVSVLRS